MMLEKKALPICPDRLRREKQNCRARKDLRDHQDQHKRFTDETRASERRLTRTQDSVLPPLTTVVPVLGSVSDSGQFFSQGIPSLD